MYLQQVQGEEDTDTWSLAIKLGESAFNIAKSGDFSTFVTTLKESTNYAIE